MFGLLKNAKRAADEAEEANQRAQDSASMVERHLDALRLQADLACEEMAMNDLQVLANLVKADDLPPNAVEERWRLWLRLSRERVEKGN